jgi:hypothetical protein
MDSIQIIFTTLENGQFVGNFPLKKETLESKESLIAFAKEAIYNKWCFLPDDWKDRLMVVNNELGLAGIPDIAPDAPKLIKLSCCVSENVEMPDWYHASDGKVYWEDLNPGEARPF